MLEVFGVIEFSELSAFFTRHYMMCGAWVVVVVLLIVVQSKLLMARISKATVNASIHFVNKEDGVFVDIRTQDNFSRGHIVNSINVTSTEIKAGKLQRIERYKEKPVIVVGKDKLDSESFNSARELKKSGFSRVFILDGGIVEWSAANLPLTVK